MKNNYKMSSYKHVLKERDYKSSTDDDERNRDKNLHSKHSSKSHKSRRPESPPRSHHHKKSPLKSKVGYDNSDHHKSRKHREAEVNESYEELSRRKRKLESELRALDLEEAAEREAENKKARKERSHSKKKATEKESRSSSRSDNGDRTDSSYRERSRVTKEVIEKEFRSSSRSDNDDRTASSYRERSRVTKEVIEKESRSSSRSDNDDRTASSFRERSRATKEVIKKESRSSSRNENDDRKRSKSKAQNVKVKVEKERNKGHSSKSSGDERGWGKPQEEVSKDSKKEKPNLAVSGKLAEETNTYNGVVIKYNEPSEARKPKRKWRLYPFKGDSDLPFIPIHRQSAYLFGRTRLIADIPIDHPSCSKQHAVLQYRLVPYKREDGTTGRRVRPYIIDLESSNGTFVNNQKIDPRCYVELQEKDVIKFGYSSREYVILHEESKNDEEDDDVIETSD